MKALQIIQDLNQGPENPKCQISYPRMTQLVRYMNKESAPYPSACVLEISDFWKEILPTL